MLTNDKPAKTEIQELRERIERLEAWIGKSNVEGVPNPDGWGFASFGTFTGFLGPALKEQWLHDVEAEPRCGQPPCLSVE